MLSFKKFINENDPCWKNYKQIGTKTKNGKTVPNCVPKDVNEELKHQPGSETTQVATTTGTYTKSATKLKNMLPKGSKVLDYGAGLGHGTKAMQDELGEHAEVHGYEPFPHRSNVQHTYTDPSEIKDKYHAVVSHNVLNVLEPELREHVVRHILGLIGENGHGIIGARKWKGDVNLAKNTEYGDEDKSVWINKKTKNGTTRVYQKGFDGNELVDYIKGIAGEHFEVKKLPGIAATAVHIRRIK